ncbi:hypothetical protein SBOR_8258 [Sclerotinia borealis F-4128]|uniref:Uncharacterized protein n=1 Tax=Sclerotinia borealis (strain F-4128) TaxID=1432307 RepID=W9C9Z5_SCLBF|nr:hypothetical protein SBOR_8258 [Sclerotinia borealis F-4128]
MGLTKVIRSVAGVLSSKNNKVPNQKDTRKSKKLTKSQRPTKTSNTTKTTKARDLVGFFTGSRSKKHAAGSDRTLVGSSNPSSAGELTFETSVQVPEHADSDYGVNNNDADITGPSFTDTVLPILMAISIDVNQIIVEDTAPSSTQDNAPLEAIVDINESNSGSEQAVEDVQTSHNTTVLDNNDADESEDEAQITCYASVTWWTEHLTLETVEVTEPIGTNPTPQEPTPENFAPIMIPAGGNKQTSEKVGAGSVSDDGSIIEDPSAPENEPKFSNELDTPDVTAQETEQPLSPEEIVEEILRTEVIPHYHQARPFLPPGISIPWGPYNPVPIRLGDFTANDPFILTESSDPVEYSKLNGIQRRWGMLEEAHQERIFYICQYNIALNHHEQQPEHVIYGFDNFCSYFGCKESTCRHSRPAAGVWMCPGLANVVPELHDLRAEEMKLVRENADRKAAELHALNTQMERLKRLEAQVQATAAERKADGAAELKKALARTTSLETGTALQAHDAVSDAPAKPDQKVDFGLKEIDLIVEPKVSRFSKFFQPQKEEETIEQVDPRDSTPDSDEPKGENDTSAGSGEDEKSTPDTSIEGPQAVPAQEAASQSEVTSQHEPGNDVYAATSPGFSDVSANQDDLSVYDVEDSREFDEDRILILGRIEGPVESYGVDSTEVLDEEGWLMVRDIDHLEFEDAAEVFDGDGWLVAELLEHPIVAYLLDAMADGLEAASDILGDMSFYVNAVDAEYEWVNSSSEEEDECDDGTEPEGSAESWGRQLLPEVGNARLGTRIVTAAIPTTSALTGGIVEREAQEAMGIFEEAHPGPEDHPDVRMNGEFSPILNGEPNMLHLSNMFRNMDRVRNEAAENWKNNPSEQDPNAPMREYLIMPGFDDEDEDIVELPRDAIVKMKEAEQKIYASGMAYARKEVAEAKDEGEDVMFTTELELVRPALISNVWKLFKVEEVASKLNITHDVAEIGDDDPFAFDEMQPTF